MADDVIGSVKVRIRPDTSRFAEETEDGVDKAVAKVNRKAKTSKDLKVQLHSTLDTKTLAQDAREALRELNAMLKTNDNLKVQFRAAISRVGMKKEVNEAHKALQAFADAKKAVDFKATLDEKEMKEVVKSVRALGDQIADELEDAGSLKFRIDEDSLPEVRKGMAVVQNALDDLKRVDIEVGLDEESLNEELARLREMEMDLPMKLKVDESSVASLKGAIAAIDRELSAQAEIEIEVGLDEASLLATRAEYAAMVASMEAETLALAAAQKRAAKEAADAAKAAAKAAEASAKSFRTMASGAGTAVSAVSGLRLIGGIFKHFRDFFSNLDQKVPMLSLLALGLAGIGGIAIKAAASMFTLARSLAQIGPGAVALPGIFGGIAIGLGATVAVFRDFNKVLPDVQGRLSAIQDSMSEKFWAQAKAPISDMIDKLLPKFATGLDATSTALGKFFGSLANGFSKELGGNVIAGMFRDLNESIAIFTAQGGNIAKIVRILGQAGAGQLPALAEWVGTLTERFANFLQKAQETGAIDSWISTAITRIKSLGEVLANAASALTGIAEAADAATPGDALQNLADGLGRLAAVTNDDGWQSKLTAVLVSVDQMMNNISSRSGGAFMAFWDNFSSTLTTILPKAGEAIGTLFDGIYSMLGSAPVQSGLVSLFEGIAKGAEALRPAFDVLAPKMGATLTLVGALAEAFGGTLTAAIEAMAPIATSLMESLTPIVERLGPVIQQVFEDLAPVFAAVGEHIAKMKDPVLSLIDSFQNLWNVVGPLLVPVLSLVVTILGGALRGVISGVALALAGITQVITGVVNVFKGLWDVIAGLFTGDFSRIGDGFKKIFSGLKDIALGALKTVAGVIWAWLNGTLVGLFRGGIAKVLTAWRGGWTGISNLAKSAWNGIKSAVSAGWTAVKNFFTKGINGIKSVWSSGWNGIKTAATTAWNAIKSAVTVGITAIRGFITNGVNTIKAFWSGGWNGVKTTLSNAWSSMVSKVTEMAGKVVNKAKEIPGLVKDGLGSLGSTLKASGVALIQGFIDGMGEMLGKAKDKARSIVSAVRDFFPFSPAKKGPFSGKGYTIHSGKALTKDFAKGMEKGGDSAKKAGGKFVQTVSNATKAAEKAAKAAARARWANLGADLMNAVGTGLRQNLPQIRNLLTQITQDIPEGISEAAAENLRKMAADINRKVDDLEDVMGEIEDKLQEIEDNARDFADTARQSLADLGNPASLGGLSLEDPTVQFEDIIANYEKATQRALDFSRVINQLRGMNLNNNTLQQLIAAGPEAGYAAAKAIADAGANGVAQVNQLAGTMEEAANGITDVAYSSMYETGMQAAEGLLEGLRSQRDALIKEIESMAGAMSEAMRQALQIRSPSRVFRKLGGYTGEGFVLGVKDYQDKAEKAITELGSGRPKPSNSPNGVRSALVGAGSTTNNRTFIYNAASGSGQLSGEESLFAALTRGRSNGF